jgi:hypothetical protein
MTNTLETGAASDSNESVARAAELIARLTALGIDHAQAERAVQEATPTQLVLLQDVVIETGIIDALEAENHAILRGLEYEAIPAADLSVLRLAGYSDPYLTIQYAARTARSLPQTLRTGETLEQILLDGFDNLRAGELGRRRKRWTGFAKLLTGSALAGVDIAGGVAAAAGGGPLAAGVTLGSVLTSCGAGIGMIFEGIGSLRGE